MDIISLREVNDLRLIATENQLPDEVSEETKERIRVEVQKLDEDEQKKHFWFNSGGSEGTPHNYYAYKAMLAEGHFKEKATVLDRLLASIYEKTRGIKERRDRLYRRLTSRRVHESARVSRQIFDALKLQVQPQPIQTQSAAPNSEIGSVADLSRILDYRLSDLNNSIVDLERSGDAWERVCGEEDEFLSALERGREHLRCAKTKFNLAEHGGDIEGVEDFLREAEGKYESLSNISDISSQSLDEIRRKLSSLKVDVEETDKLIDSELWKPFYERRKILLIKLRKRVGACEALGDLSNELQERYRVLIQTCEKENIFQEFLDGPRLCAEEFTELEQINMQVGEILNRNLSEVEKQVFSSIVELDSQQGIDLDSLK